MSPPGRVPAPPHGSPADGCRHAGTPANTHCIGHTLPDSIAGLRIPTPRFSKAAVPTGIVPSAYSTKFGKPAVHLPAVNSFFSESFLHNAETKSVLLVFLFFPLPVFSTLLLLRFSGILSFLLQSLSGSVLRLPVLFPVCFFRCFFQKIWAFSTGSIPLMAKNAACRIVLIRPPNPISFPIANPSMQ